MKRLCAIGIIFLAVSSPVCADQLVLVAGGGAGKDNVPATRAQLISPFAVDFDKAGNMFICELEGGRLLRVDPKGVLTVVAGTGAKGNSGDGGLASVATFNGTHNLAVLPDGTVLLADTWNNRIRKYDPTKGTINAFAGTGNKGFSGDGGPALKANFTGIYSLARAVGGSKLYLADLENRRIRMIDMKSKIVTTVAGNGKKGVPQDDAIAAEAPLVDPRAVAADRLGNIYILERSGHALRVVNAEGKIRTVAGTGKAGPGLGGGNALKAQFNSPKHLCIDLDNNVIIADSGNHRILRYESKRGCLALVAGTGKKGESGNGGPALEVSLNEPHGVCVHPSGTLYIVDSLNNRVFRLEK